MRFAYADPPYLGQSHRYDHPDAARWDNPAEHTDLMAELDAVFDGWAYSCGSVDLACLLPGAPAGTRVAAWVKPFAAFKPHVRLAYAWEPVLWRRISPRRDNEPLGRDWHAANITLRRGVVGAKPASFAAWLRVLFGALEEDELLDLFPGSGAVSAEWDALRLAL